MMEIVAPTALRLSIVPGSRQPLPTTEMESKVEKWKRTMCCVTAKYENRIASDESGSQLRLLNQANTARDYHLKWVSIEQCPDNGGQQEEQH